MFSTRVTFKGKHRFITNLRYVRRIFIPSIIIRRLNRARKEIFFFLNSIVRTVLLFNENNKFRIVSFSFFDLENL